MSIKDYKFKIGDEVITIYGLKGRIINVCTCLKCHGRGFYEPSWIAENGDVKFITMHDAMSDFNSYYKIGDYRFRDFDKVEVLNEMASYEKELAQLKVQLKTIEEIENGK